MLLPIKNNQSLGRDMKSKALVNTNRSEAESYKIKTAAMARMRDQASEINNMKKQLDELTTLKADFQEIKSMLSAVLNK